MQSELWSLVEDHDAHVLESELRSLAEDHDAHVLDKQLLLAQDCRMENCSITRSN